MIDSTTKNLPFIRPIPQGSASPAPGSVWTDEYGWIVPAKLDYEAAYEAFIGRDDTDWWAGIVAAVNAALGIEGNDD